VRQRPVGRKLAHFLHPRRTRKLTAETGGQSSPRTPHTGCTYGANEHAQCRCLTTGFQLVATFTNRKQIPPDLCATPCAPDATACLQRQRTLLGGIPGTPGLPPGFPSTTNGWRRHAPMLNAIAPTNLANPVNQTSAGNNRANNPANNPDCRPPIGWLTSGDTRYGHFQCSSEDRRRLRQLHS